MFRKAIVFSLIFCVFWQCNHSSSESETTVDGVPEVLATVDSKKKIAADFTVSLTTLPSRIKGLVPVINSILNGTVLPSEIVVNIPDYSWKEKVEYKLPAFLLNPHPIIKVLRSADWGPNTKFIPIIQDKKAKYKENDDILIIDDDQEYPPEMIENFIKWRARFPDAVIANRGHQMPDSLKFADAGTIHGYEINEPVRVAVVTGVGGYLIKSRFFNTDIWQDLPLPQYGKSREEAAAYFVDDAWISAILAKNDLKSYVIPINNCWSHISHQAVNQIGGGGKLNDLVFQEYAQYWTDEMKGKLNTIQACQEDNKRKHHCMPCLGSDNEIH